MLRCMLVSSLLLVLPVASIQQACDISQPAAEVCEDFCTSKCSFFNATAGETGQATNITLYRITPKNVTGIQNKNTGDAPGDVSFFLGRKNITQRCAQDQAAFGCFLEGDNVYGELVPLRSPDADPDRSHSLNPKAGKFTVEIDGKYGPYFECNPINVFNSVPTPPTPRCAAPRHATPRHATLHGAAPRHAAPRRTEQEADRISAVATPVQYGAYGQPIAGFPTPAWVDTRTFECGQGCLQPTAGDCHDRKQRNGTSSFGGGFDCWCDRTVTAPLVRGSRCDHPPLQRLPRLLRAAVGSQEASPRRLNGKARLRQHALGRLPSNVDATAGSTV